MCTNTKSMLKTKLNLYNRKLTPWVPLNFNCKMTSDPRFLVPEEIIVMKFSPVYANKRKKYLLLTIVYSIEEISITSHIHDSIYIYVVNLYKKCV